MQSDDKMYVDDFVIEDMVRPSRNFTAQGYSKRSGWTALGMKGDADYELGGRRHIRKDHMSVYDV
jgi:hypothetical protein